MQSKQIESEVYAKNYSCQRRCSAIANIESEKYTVTRHWFSKKEQIKALDDEFKAQFDALQTDLNNQLEIHAQSGQSLIDLKIQKLNIQEQQRLQQLKELELIQTFIEKKYANAKIELVKAEQRAKMSIYANFAGSVLDLLGENTKV